jgi:structural maintenance of chromosome 1
VGLVYIVAEGEVEGLDDGEELLFERAIMPAGGSVYSVNGNKVSEDQYHKGLLEIGVDIKAKNFLVFQGDVEAVAKKKPRDMLQYFELFCGSAELQAPFAAAQAALEEARKEQHTRALARKTVQGEVRDLRAAKEEADRHAEMSAEVERLRTRHMLLKLYYLDQAITTQSEALEEAAGKLAAAGTVEEGLEARQRAVARDAAGASKAIEKKEAQLKAKSAQAREAGERHAAASARLESLRAALSACGGKQRASAEALNSTPAPPPGSCAAPPPSPTPTATVRL